jgi:hypothetical protein
MYETLEEIQEVILGIPGETQEIIDLPEMIDMIETDMIVDHHTIVNATEDINS